MRKFLVSLSLIAIVLAILGADIRRQHSSTQEIKVSKKKCLGYTIIEFGKGIDCNGDTVKLVRVNGVQVLAESI